MQKGGGEMRVGSLVELVNNNWCNVPFHNPMCGIINFPVKSTVYTVRSIVKMSGETAIILEEIRNDICKMTGFEEAFLITRFRELQPPIANIEEHIKENTLELVELERNKLVKS